ESDQVFAGHHRRNPPKRAGTEFVLVSNGMVGARGVEPPSSSVSGHPRPFASSVATWHATTSALLRSVTEPGTEVRREAAYGIAADNLLTGGTNCTASDEHQLDGTQIADR